MTYKLKFKAPAKKEWDKLDSTIKSQFKKKLQKVLKRPHVINNKLAGDLNDLYKIKLADKGYRLVYEVNDKEITVYVVAVGKRNKNLVYKIAKDRIK